MRSRLIYVLPITVVAGLFPAFGHAADATEEGATALTAVLQTYLGATDGVVTVEPDGEAYAVTLDFAPLIAKAPTGTTASVTPIEFSLADNGDGTWKMVQDQAVTVSLMAPGQAEFTASIGSLTGSGVFDTTLGAFSSSSTKASDIAVTQKVTDPELGQTDVAYTVKSLSYESTAKAATAGGVDSSASYSLEGLSETFTLPQMGMPLTLTAELTTGTSEISGLRPDAFYKLIAFFVANPDQAAIALHQDDLKTIVGAGIPLFDHLVSDSTTTALNVETPMGPASVANLSFQVELNGIVSAGLFREAISFDGLTLPPAVVPEWAVDLVPQSMSLDVAASKFDLAAPAKMLLNILDLTKPDTATTPEQDAALLAALLPEGVVAVKLAPGGIKAPIYEVTYEGEMTAGPATGPSAKATVTASGMTAVKQALTKVPEDVGMQIAPVLGMAEGLAKPGENGALVWELEATPEGAMTVNGLDLSTMAGSN